jgi:uncharacterized protein
MAAYPKPLPQPNADDRFFWEGCRMHEMRFQECTSCGFIRWPASILCPSCHSTSTRYIKAAGKGKIYTFAVHHRAYHPGFQNDLPYITAVIALDEGPHFLSNIVDCKSDEVYCDMPVEVVWEDIDEAFSLPKFRPSQMGVTQAVISV